MTVVVVGAGVIGLTCAVRLAEAGHRVRVVAREPTLASTSTVAAALWFPYHVGPPERVDGWAARSYRVLGALAAGSAESGVVMREILVLERAGKPAPGWRRALDGFRTARADELPAGHRDGWLARVPVVETPRYLPWLVAHLAAAGVTVELVPGGVSSLDAVADGAALVVNCTGLGARALAADPSMVPVRGQVVLLENPGLERVLLDEDDPAGPTYVVPRRDDCVLGGTAEPGVESLEPDPEATASILARATRLVPALAGARLLGVRVGLRPARPAVRLELERRVAGPPVIHCYGHGGAGHTLAWGCADEVLALAQQALGAAS